MFPVRAWKIDNAGVVAFDHAPARFEIVRRQAELGCKNVDRSHRQKSERRFRTGQSVYDFIDGAIAAGGHDFCEAFTRGMTRECFRVPRLGSRADLAVLRERFNTRSPTPGAIAVRRRIQNNDRVIHLFFKHALRNVSGVPKLLRLVLVLLCVVVALFVIVLIGANLYVQSRGTQARIEQELSQRLHTPVRIRSIAVTPWGGLSLSGLTIPQATAPPGGNFLEARAFQVRLKFAALLAKKITIKEVVLVDPTVVWLQARDGKWRLPGAVLEETASVAAEETTEATESPNDKPSATPDEAAAQPTERTATSSTPPPSKPIVQHISIKRGDFSFLNRSGTALAKFAGVNVRSTIDDDSTLHGQATAERVDLRDRFELTELRTPIRYAPAQLELPKISARAAGGELSGNFLIEPQSPNSPFDFSIKFRSLDADQLVRQAGGPAGTIQGKLGGAFAAKGRASDQSALKGAGEFSLRDGQLRQYSLLVALGQILQIEELTQLHLDQADAKYHVDLDVITVDEIVLRSPNLRLTANGTVDFDGKLHLNAQLAINDKIREQLFKPMRANFQPLNEAGMSAVDFQITGTLERPKTNLVEKVVGRDIKDLGDVVRGFLGGNKSEKPKKKRARDATLPNESASPVDATAASPTP